MKYLLGESLHAPIYYQIFLLYIRYIFHIWLNHLYLPSREFGCLYMCIYRFRTLPNKAYFHNQLPGTCWRQLEPDPWISSKPSLSSGVWWDLGRGYKYIYIYTLTLQRPLIFGVFQEKLHFFPKVLFLKSSTVFCMLVMFTHGGTAETVEIK